MSKSQRTKGAGGEREACALLESEFGKPAKRNLGQARDSGTDITYPPFGVEVKRRKRIANLYEWMEQAASAQQRHPVSLVRADGKGWLVVMRFEDWAALARGEIE